MKTNLLKLILIVLAVAQVKGIPQGTPAEEAGKPATSNEKPTPGINQGAIAVQKLREQFPELIKNLPGIADLKGPPSTNQPAGFGIGTLYNALLGGVHSLYQDLLNRQQAFINLLTCGNCVNDGWDAIMEVALTIPELEWLQKPSESSPATFFTAVHQNGTVTGIGGSVVKGKPVAEYAFGNDGITQHLNKHKKDKEKRK